MAQAACAYEPDATPRSLALPAAPQVIAVGDAAVVWTESPARALHDQLVQSFATPARRDDRLPLGVRLAAIGVAVAAPWAAIALVATLVM